jgi:hypothetical protein
VLNLLVHCQGRHFCSTAVGLIFSGAFPTFTAGNRYSGGTEMKKPCGRLDSDHFHDLQSVILQTPLGKVPKSGQQQAPVPVTQKPEIVGERIIVDLSPGVPNEGGYQQQ